MQISTCDTAAAGNGVRGRPRMATVFGAAFVAGALAAFGINRALDVHLAQARPQVECEPIFVALRALPQGTPITVWDVALRDWPKAMLPTTALRAHDTFEGMVLRHPLREGQPLVAAQLVKADESNPSARVAGAAAWPATPAPAVEPWTPARPAEAPSTAGVATAAVAPVAAAPDCAPTTIAAAPATDPTAQSVAAATETAAAAAVASAPPVGEPGAGDRFGLPAAAPVADSAPPVAADVAAVEPRPAPPAAHEFGTDSTATTAAVPDAAAALTDLPATGQDLVDELPPSDAATATVTDVVALPAVAAPDAPTLADPLPAEAAVADAAVGPLVAPVPMSPPTDIESTLASITGSRPRAAAPAAPESSVLERSAPAAAQPPPPSAPLRYLVVPERIALQADASFVTPQRPADDRAGPGTNREASAQQRTRPRGSGPAPRSAGSASADGQRRPAAGAPRPAGPGRPEPTPPKAGNWLPKLGFGVFGSGGTR
jgi:hypothetical protein